MTTLIFFCTRLCKSYSWGSCSFPDCLEQLKKKPENSLWLGTHQRHKKVVWGNLENCSKPRRNFNTALCRNIWDCTLPHEICLSIRSYEPFSLPVMSGHWFRKQDQQKFRKCYRYLGNDGPQRKHSQINRATQRTGRHRWYRTNSLHGLPRASTKQAGRDKWDHLNQLPITARQDKVRNRAKIRNRYNQVLHLT